LVASLDERMKLYKEKYSKGKGAATAPDNRARPGRQEAGGAHSGKGKKNRRDNPRAAQGSAKLAAQPQKKPESQGAPKTAIQAARQPVPPSGTPQKPGLLAKFKGLFGKK
jgi:hypothetical protein